MPTSRPPLSYDVFVAPEKPFIAPPSRVGDPPAWDPTTSTLIFGARDAVLVDSLTTVREATALADWVALHERRLTTIYITHGHGDHYLGLSVVLTRFPDARAVATAGTVELMRKDTRPEALNPDAANNYRARFPGEIAEAIALAEPLDAEYLDIEGLPLHVIETGHTDTVDTTSLHVPDLGLIVSGDVAYNHCHMYVGATTADGRAEWELFDAMVARYPDWLSRQQFLILGFTGSAGDRPGTPSSRQPTATQHWVSGTAGDTFPRPRISCGRADRSAQQTPRARAAHQRCPGG
jgi:glyoxylase-like metal-dependent hydrolase (beta-lactamase superfamily II)